MDVYSAWTSCHKMCLVCGLVLELCLVGSAFDQESPLTPGEAVQLWLKVYPEHLERAVDLTTLSFRQGVSKKEWLGTQGPLLRGLPIALLWSPLLGSAPRDGRMHQEKWFLSAFKTA